MGENEPKKSPKGRYIEPEPHGFYGSWYKEGDQREAQWRFCVALVQNAPGVIEDFVDDAFPLYLDWRKAEAQEFGDDAVITYPTLWELHWAREDCEAISEAEGRLYDALRDWARQFCIEYDWIYRAAMQELWHHWLAKSYRHEAWIGTGFQDSNNVHGVPHRPELKRIQINLPKWDPQSWTYTEYDRNLRYRVHSLIKQQLDERLSSHRAEVEDVMKLAGYSERPKRRNRSGCGANAGFFWLVEYLVLGKSYAMIAQKPGLSAAAICKAVRKAAMECGVTLPERKS